MIGESSVGDLGWWHCPILAEGSGWKLVVHGREGGGWDSTRVAFTNVEVLEVEERRVFMDIEKWLLHALAPHNFNEERIVLSTTSRDADVSRCIC